ncbi:pyridoxamine 5'-phosphate oxidase [Kitasatospora sp. SolWspMP-SS2h]|uniref:pyridoxamine 5'-phosphate oxidase family protein n=1 Tax=Kitasatospora sp. SolWspMP-SS2h TaxID=1305729 RepID=UPI000DB9CFD2|nr:pyridoxamine 5'-phosphate oxidase family protein [Kitasatospora sp. SolWspMP-SS2h]RAJ43518.1 pyridoxamine 5'-phosphate oxidase [Kitasatospora sp. SolWspMP-SS2h]
MTTWQEFEQQAPDLAPRIRARFEAHKHHVLATLTRDGSPRVSGTEVDFQGPELFLGSMAGAVKAADLRRDGRCALHSNPGPGTDMVGGDAKLSSRAVELTDPAEIAAYEAALPGPPPGPYHAFRLELTGAVLTEVADDHLVISSWRPGEAVRVVERR